MFKKIEKENLKYIGPLIKLSSYACGESLNNYTR